jgi:predicted nuclease with RNAse H fold
MALVTSLEAQGLRVVTVDPQTALGRLEQEAHRRNRAEGVELAEIGDDDMDAIVA